MAKKGTPRTSKGLAVFCARIAEAKLAENVIIMNLSKIEAAPTDFFVVCSCSSNTQVSAISDELLKQCRSAGIKRPRLEGILTNYWVLADFFDVVVHIMIKEARDYYKLEKLWVDAQFLKLGSSGVPKIITQDELKSIIRDKYL